MDKMSVGNVGKVNFKLKQLLRVKNYFLLLKIWRLVNIHLCCSKNLLMSILLLNLWWFVQMKSRRYVCDDKNDIIDSSIHQMKSKLMVKISNRILILYLPKRVYILMYSEKDTNSINNVNVVMAQTWKIISFQWVKHTW